MITFVWSKCSDVLKRLILLEDIRNAADLWSWLKHEDSEASRDSLLMLQHGLFNMTLQHDETIAGYAVRLQIALGGESIPEKQMIMHLAKDFPGRLLHAKVMAGVIFGFLAFCGRLNMYDIHT